MFELLHLILNLLLLLRIAENQLTIKSDRSIRYCFFLIVIRANRYLSSFYRYIDRVFNKILYSDLTDRRYIESSKRSTKIDTDADVDTKDYRYKSMIYVI